MCKQIYGRMRLMTGLILALLFPCLSEGAVVANPSVVIFTSPMQSATIALLNDGRALATSEILDSQLLASGHDYRHMLSLEKLDGAVRIMPSSTLEVGSYDLTIQTTLGAVNVRVFAPLSEVPDYVEKMSLLTGESEKQIEAKLGMATAVGREEIQLNLPPVYYEGQTLELTMPEPKAPGRTSLWFINGELASEESGSRSLSYTFSKPGEFVFTYMETEQINGTTTMVARARAITRVVEVPRLNSTVAVNTEISFHAPAGYRQFNWYLNGVAVSKEADYRYTFQSPGVHEVECAATEPTYGPAMGYLRNRYSVVVN